MQEIFHVDPRTGYPWLGGAATADDVLHPSDFPTAARLRTDQLFHRMPPAENRNAPHQSTRSFAEASCSTSRRFSSRNASVFGGSGTRWTSTIRRRARRLGLQRRT